MFTSIEYSEPKILTWNLHHHSPSYLAVLLCLREKLARHVPLLDSPVNFAEQYSSLIVWQFVITMTFLRSNYVQANLFLIYLFSLCDSFIMSKISQICGGLYFLFIKRQSYWQSCRCRAIGKTNSTIVWCLENELNCHMISDTKFTNRFLIDTSCRTKIQID